MTESSQTLIVYAVGAPQNLSRKRSQFMLTLVSDSSSPTDSLAPSGDPDSLLPFRARQSINLAGLNSLSAAKAPTSAKSRPSIVSVSSSEASSAPVELEIPSDVNAVDAARVLKASMMEAMIKSLNAAAKRQNTMVPVRHAVRDRKAMYPHSFLTEVFTFPGAENSEPLRPSTTKPIVHSRVKKSCSSWRLTPKSYLKSMGISLSAFGPQEEAPWSSPLWQSIQSAHRQRSFTESLVNVVGLYD